MKYFAALAMMLFVAAPIHAEAKVVQACTQMWCNEGMTLDLKTEIWPVGDYTFEVKADDLVYSCTASLPFTDCEATVHCDKEGLTIMQSGCALPTDQHSFSGVMLKDIPKHIALKVSRADGQSFSFEQDVTPQCGFPNGERCDVKQCCSANLSADVAWE